MLDFPSNPTTNQRFPEPPILGGPQWQWDGVKWVSVLPPSIIEEPVGPGVWGRRETGQWEKALPLAGGVMEGRLHTATADFYVNNPNPSLAPLEIMSGPQDALLAFHRQGYFGCYFGLHSGDNQFWYGGWSFGAAAYKIWSSQNFDPNSKLTTDGRITAVGWDNVGHMTYTVDNAVTNTIANYGDLPDAWGIARYVMAYENPQGFTTAAWVQSWAYNGVRWVHVGDGGTSAGGVAEAINGGLISSFSNTFNARYRALQCHIPALGWVAQAGWA